MVSIARLAFAIVDALFIIVGIQQIYIERSLKGALGDLQYFTPRLMVAAYCFNLITNVLFVIASMSDCNFCQNYAAFVAFGASKDAGTLIDCCQVFILVFITVRNALITADTRLLHSDLLLQFRNALIGIWSFMASLVVGFVVTRAITNKVGFDSAILVTFAVFLVAAATSLIWGTYALHKQVASVASTGTGQSLASKLAPFFRASVASVLLMLLGGGVQIFNASAFLSPAMFSESLFSRPLSDFSSLQIIEFCGWTVSMVVSWKRAQAAESDDQESGNATRLQRQTSNSTALANNPLAKLESDIELPSSTAQI